MACSTRVIAVLALAALLTGAAADHGRDQPCDKGFEHTGKITGSVVKIAGLNVYVAAPAAGKSSHRGRYPTVILFPDIYGYKQNSTRLWADNLAKEGGFVVVLPDFFRGDDWSETRDRAGFAAWIAQFPSNQVLKDTDAILAELRDKGVRGYKTGRIGAQGFCWGGLYSNLLVTGDKPRASAAVVFHGSRQQPADINAITNPIYFLQSDPDLDPNFNCTLYQVAVNKVDSLRDKHVDARFRSYEGIGHGFTLRGDPKNSTVQAAAKDAFARGARFLVKQLRGRW